MEKRRRAVQHLWNRFLAAVLFVLGAALTTAAPSETQQARLSRAEATQLDAANIGRQLAAASDVRLDGARASHFKQAARAAPSPTFAFRETGQPSAVFRDPARRAERIARDGESRAPPAS